MNLRNNLVNVVRSFRLHPSNHGKLKSGVDLLDTDNSGVLFFVPGAESDWAYENSSVFMLHIWGSLPLIRRQTKVPVGTDALRQGEAWWQIQGGKKSWAGGFATVVLGEVYATSARDRSRLMSRRRSLGGHDRDRRRG